MAEVEDHKGGMKKGDPRGASSNAPIKYRVQAWNGWTGWHLVSVHDTMKEAQDAADEAHRISPGMEHAVRAFREGERRFD